MITITTIFDLSKSETEIFEKCEKVPFSAAVALRPANVLSCVIHLIISYTFHLLYCHETQPIRTAEDRDIEIRCNRIETECNCVESSL